MKNIFKFTLLASALVTLLWACEKDEKKDYFKGGTPPVLTASTNASADSVSLLYVDAEKTALTFKWTNPEYQFTTGVSSQDVTYTVEIDTAGANFTNPNKKQVVVSKDLSLTLKESELNDYLLNQLALQPDTEHSLEIRVIATLGSSTAVALTSNVLPLKAKPYSIPPKVTPPTDGTLWIVGNAVASGWSNPLPAPYDESQKFTKVSNTLYELTVDLIPGGGYKLIQTQGVWGTQYHALDGKADLSGDFEQKDSDPQFPAPAVAGKYKISVDFQRGKYTLTKQ